MPTVAERIVDKEIRISFLRERIEKDRDTIRQLMKEIGQLKNQELLHTISEINIPASELMELLQQIKDGTYHQKAV